MLLRKTSTEIFDVFPKLKVLNFKLALLLFQKSFVLNLIKIPMKMYIYFRF